MPDSECGGHVVLVGMTGVGKTTVGRALAARLGRRFVDTDELVEAHTGRTVREIFATSGEAAFRAAESAALAAALASPEPCVVAVAAGAVLAEANRRALREVDGHVVWLSADPDVLVARVGGSGHRPLLDGDPGGALARMAAERRPLYAQVARQVVDVAGRSVDEVVDSVLAEVAV